MTTSRNSLLLGAIVLCWATPAPAQFHPWQYFSGTRCVEQTDETSVHRSYSANSRGIANRSNSKVNVFCPIDANVYMVHDDETYTVRVWAADRSKAGGFWCSVYASDGSTHATAPRFEWTQSNIATTSDSFVGTTGKGNHLPDMTLAKPAGNNFPFLMLYCAIPAQVTVTGGPDQVSSLLGYAIGELETP